MDIDEIVDRLLVEELAQAWESANYNLFRDALRRPVIGLADTTSRMGSWARSTRSLTIAREHARHAPWVEVLDTLFHEMAHQYVDEVLRVTDETAHGPAFQRVLHDIGIARLGGAPVVEDAALAKVRKLLALAGSPNQHEAEVAARTAQRLMLKYNVDLAASRTTSAYEVRHIGPARARHPAWETLLIGILSQHFFIKVVWVRLVERKLKMDRHFDVRLTHVNSAECMGTAANLDIAEYVFAFLSNTGERLWREHKQARRLKGDKDRQRFLSGIMVGFRQQLDEGRAQSAAEGLVWVRDGGLDDFERRRFPRLQSRGGISLTRSEAYDAGKEAGRNITLHKPVTSTGRGGGLLEG